MVYTAAGQLITIALGLVLPRFFITSYGSEMNGLLNSVNQFLVYLGFFEAGVGAATTQALYKPIALGQKDQINGVLSATNIYYKKASLYYLCGLIAFSLIYALFVDTAVSFTQVFLIVLFSGMGNVVLFRLQGKYRLLLIADGRSYINSNIATVCVVLTSLNKILMIYMGCPVVWIVIATFAINLLQAAYILFYIRRHYNWLDLKVEPNNISIGQKNYVLVHEIANMVFSNTDVLLLTVFTDLKVVSVYSMYKLVIGHLESILKIINGSVGFAFGQTYQTDLEKYKKQINVFETVYSAVGFSLMSVALFLLPPFLTLYTDGISDINYVDQTVALLFVLIAVLTIMRQPMLNTISFAGHFKQTTPQTIAETVINLTVSITGVLWLGIYGVLLGTVAALLYRNIDVILYANKKLLNRSSIHTFTVYAINGILLVAMQPLYSLLFGNIGNYLDFAICGACLTVITVLVFLTAQVCIFKDCRTVVFPMLKKSINKFLRH